MNEQEILKNLNEDQQKACACTDGPVLILAGAGSGKTRVLVHRIAYLIDVKHVNPGNILAITFTNKAADEMRSRVDEMIGFGAEEIWVSTFHALCVRILRRNADLLGFTRWFSIYDTDDQLTLMKNICKAKNVDTRTIREKSVLAAISSAKDELIDPDRYRYLNKDKRGQIIADLYREYQAKLKENNAMDFDDLIMKTVELFRQFPDVLAVCQERFRYLMVDEYQDTNTAQFAFISLLADKYRNLCVVGDDDQSIYKFRGANIRNILNFENVYPDAHIVKLERNYRSTQNILDAANEVIRHNHGRKDKSLWTENGRGGKVRLRRFRTGFDEADYIISEIRRLVRSGEYAFRDCAVLYRTNAQSRLFEEKALMQNIPYKIVGGVNFYARKEIKDILAYLKTIDNAVDALAVRRIINIPKRGIGTATITRIEAFAEAGGISFYDAVCAAGSIPNLSAAAAKKVSAFADFISVLRAKAEDAKVSELIKEIVESTGYAEALKNEHTLIADIDTVDESDDRVLFMTLHAAKGLEFPVVFMAGMEDGLFPSSMSINAYKPEEEIEEERRLAYVGITRAKKLLTLTCARERMIRGDLVQSPLSRFVREIPRELIDMGEDEMESPRPRLNSMGINPDMRDAILGRAFAPKPSFGRAFPMDAEEDEVSFGRSFDASRDNAYTHKSTYKNPYLSASKPQGAGSAEKTLPDYRVGDKVRHVKFGEGTVKEIKDGGRDYLVTVDFPAWGVKKMLAGFAKLKKV